MVLFHGPDSAASLDYANMLSAALGSAADVDVIAGKQLASDPQALVAAASSLSMFGDARIIRVTGLDDDGLPAVEALLAGPAAAHRVIAVAGGFKKGSKLLALAEKSESIASMISYAPSAGNAPRMIGDIAAPLGLKPDRDAAMALFDATGGDRMIIRRELEKLALYRDAGPERPQSLTLADVAAASVGAGDAEQSDLVAAITAGQPARVVDLVGRMPGGTAIPLLRALDRRLSLLLGLRAVVESGSSPAQAVDSARPPVFWKDKDATTAELTFWTQASLTKAMSEVLAAERAVKATGSLGDLGADAVVIAMARRAHTARRRVQR
ncbi:DNA polymerase III subunit delta [Sandarakinorhabdus sp.]|uniref:DNA polymerase III subunit delta n=1 Tax=Sandarakinorhabdus sp. TaxID=1916663 RepID=UPI00286E81B9|nr:DNA polymerase III subunit delta [Sandarakinorhabdus sp.]